MIPYWFLFQNNNKKKQQQKKDQLKPLLLNVVKWSDTL